MGNEGLLVHNSCFDWDNLVPTQPLYDAVSKIYKSFELKFPKQNIWVHGNATEHLRELEVKIMNSGKTPAQRDLDLQLMLGDFYGAIEQATKNGVVYNQDIKIGRWFLKFSPPRQGQALPVLFHAQPLY